MLSFHPLSGSQEEYFRRTGGLLLLDLGCLLMKLRDYGGRRSLAEGSGLEKILKGIRNCESSIEFFFEATNRRSPLMPFICKKSESTKLNMPVCRIYSVLAYQLIHADDDTVSVSMLSRVCSLADSSSILECRRLANTLIVENAMEFRVVAEREGSGQCVHVGFSDNSLFLETLLGGKKSIPFLTQKVMKELRRELEEKKNPQRKTPPGPVVIPSPRTIYNELTKVVLGQDDQCKMVAVRGWTHLQRCQLLREKKVVGKNTNLLFLGDSGTGKTLCAERFGVAAGVPFCSLSATEFTSVGIVGADLIEDTARAILTASGNPDPEEMPKKIIGSAVFLDEWTKKASGNGREASEVRDLVRGGVQKEALRMMEGATAILSHRAALKPTTPNKFSFDGIMFMFAGFIPYLPDIIRDLKRRKTGMGFGVTDDKWKRGDYLYDALEEAGLIPEFLNRLSGVAVFQPLSIETLMQIATYEHGTIATYNELLSPHGLRVSISQETVRTMAEICYESKMAGRGLRLLTEYMMEEALFEEKRGAVELGMDDLKKATERLGT